MSGWVAPTSLEVRLPFALPYEDTVGSIVVERWAAHDPDRVVIEQDDGTTVTYAQLDQRASAIAGGLRALGVEAGDRVATLTANDVRVAYTALALNKLGAIEVPVNPALVGQSLQHVLGDADPRAVVVSPEFRAALDAALPAGARPIIVTSSLDGDREVSGPTLDGLLAEGPSSLPTAPDVRPDTPVAIMYTSGTTGLPKGALVPHRMAHLIAERTAGSLALTDRDVLLSILPLFHAGGRYMNIAACALVGARCGFVRRFSGSAYFDQARQFDATAMHGLVSVGHFLLAQEPSDADRDHRITRGLLTPAAPEFAAAFSGRFGIEIFEGYAQTESGIVALNLDGPKGAAGRVYPPYRAKIVDEHGQRVPTGETGEIVISSDEPWSTFLGYWNQPETTLETVRNFGQHTGDAGRIDEDGMLWFVDRIKDMIRRRGENVAALTVETAINQLDAVEECAAYPVPSEFGDEEIAIAIVLAPGREASAEDVITHAREHLPRFAVPRFVRILDALPKTETGKIQKFQLKREGINGAVEIEEVRR